MEESESSEGFKITDKRRFTAEGAKSEEASKPKQDAEREKASETEPVEKPVTEPDRAAAEEKDLPPVTFTHLVLSLANTALFQLGLLGSPESEGKKDLQGARQTIDLIAVLEEKTRGNLDDQEKRILTETLFQLRMAFVEAAK
jgi:Domain of unknown function (DUF1844)